MAPLQSAGESLMENQGPAPRRTGALKKFGCVAFFSVLCLTSVHLVDSKFCKPRDDAGHLHRAVCSKLSFAHALAKKMGLGGSSGHLLGGKFICAPPDSQDVRTLVREGKGWEEGRTLGQRVSVLVWNLQKEQDATFRGAYDKLTQGRDLLLLQEMHLRDGVEDFLLGERGLGYLLAPAFSYEKDNSPAGVSLGSTVRPTTHEVQVTEDKEPVVGTPKSALIAEYALSGGDGPLLVTTVHGINRAPVEAFEKQLDRIALRLRRHSGPMILAGDFNTQSAKKTQYLEDLASSLNLQAVTFNPDTRTLSKMSRRPLDHAFVRGARVEAAKTWDAIGGSDHVALTFDLVF